MAANQTFFQRSSQSTETQLQLVAWLLTQTWFKYFPPLCTSLSLHQTAETQMRQERDIRRQELWHQFWIEWDILASESQFKDLNIYEIQYDVWHTIFSVFVMANLWFYFYLSLRCCTVTGDKKTSLRVHLHTLSHGYMTSTISPPDVLKHLRYPSRNYGKINIQITQEGEEKKQGGIKQRNERIPFWNLGHNIQYKLMKLSESSLVKVNTKIYIY